MWVEFVVGCRLDPRVSLRIPQFSFFVHKTNIFKFQFDQDRGPPWKSCKADVASSPLQKLRLPVCEVLIANFLATKFISKLELSSIIDLAEG